MCRLRAVTFERPDRSAEQREGAMKRAETERRNVKISHFPDSRKKMSAACSVLYERSAATDEPAVILFYVQFANWVDV